MLIGYLNFIIFVRQIIGNPQNIYLIILVLFFSCIVVLSVENKVLKSKGYGKSKKDAKQSASQVFMIQHQLET